VRPQRDENQVSSTSRFFASNPSCRGHRPHRWRVLVTHAKRTQANGVRHPSSVRIAIADLDQDACSGEFFEPGGQAIRVGCDNFRRQTRSELRCPTTIDGLTGQSRFLRLQPIEIALYDIRSGKIFTRSSLTAVHSRLWPIESMATNHWSATVRVRSAFYLRSLASAGFQCRVLDVTRQSVTFVRCSQRSSMCRTMRARYGFASRQRSSNLPMCARSAVD